MVNTHTHTHTHTHVYVDKSHHNYNSSEFRVYYHIDTCGFRCLRVRIDAMLGVHMIGVSFGHLNRSSFYAD